MHIEASKLAVSDIAELKARLQRIGELKPWLGTLTQKGFTDLVVRGWIRHDELQAELEGSDD